MSSEKPHEFFLDRSLGKTTAARLREAGYRINLIADFYPLDAADIADEQWIKDGCSRGWILLTKDQRIRYRPSELGALNGRMFCLASGNQNLSEQADTLLRAMPAIMGACAANPIGFWKIYADGRLRKTWP